MEKISKSNYHENQHSTFNKNLCFYPVFNGFRLQIQQTCIKRIFNFSESNQIIFLLFFGLKFFLINKLLSVFWTPEEKKEVRHNWKYLKLFSWDEFYFKKKLPLQHFKKGIQIQQKKKKKNSKRKSRKTHLFYSNLIHISLFPSLFSGNISKLLKLLIADFCAKFCLIFLSFLINFIFSNKNFEENFWCKNQREFFRTPYKQVTGFANQLGKLSEYSIKESNLSKSLWWILLLLNPFVAKTMTTEMYDFAFWSCFENLLSFCFKSSWKSRKSFLKIKRAEICKNEAVLSKMSFKMMTMDFIKWEMFKPASELTLFEAACFVLHINYVFVMIWKLLIKWMKLYLLHRGNFMNIFCRF